LRRLNETLEDRSPKALVSPGLKKTVGLNKCLEEIIKW